MKAASPTTSELMKFLDNNKVNALNTASARNPRFATGKKTKTVEYEASITAAASDDDDLYFLVDGLSFADRISGVRANSAGTPALTAATDNDLGFYSKNEDGTFAAIGTGDELWNGVSLATAKTDPNLLTALNASLDHSQNIGELLSLGVDREPAGGVFLILKTNTATSAAGPLLLRLAIDVDVATTAGSEVPAYG